jgi:hypothetical protein
VSPATATTRATCLRRLEGSDVFHDLRVVHRFEFRVVTEVFGGSARLFEEHFLLERLLGGGRGSGRSR